MVFLLEVGFDWMISASNEEITISSWICDRAITTKGCIPAYPNSVLKKISMCLFMKTEISRTIEIVSYLVSQPID
ncbi:MAG: hypothetical protein DI538_19020 [Azospira oryzae]|nr:MAG: hypothetical protein DI538_19020 [Azospira oryzae]